MEPTAGDAASVRPGGADPVVLARDLAAWYAGNARDLPWRRDPTPYRVLLSELMLQQTRVETVIPYFERFVARWPSLEALAGADDAELLAAWAGLGYYRRAANLLACARAAVAAGGLPNTRDGLLTLPGIGPYTAGAVASIAFGEAVPIVDGNVERVLCRIDACADDPRKAGRRAVWARAQAIVEGRPAGVHPGQVNQALMELGATVCSPQRPRCLACPVRAGCAAAAAGTAEDYPVRPAKAPPRPLAGVRVVIEGPEGMLLGRRPPGLLGGLWEPLGIDWEPTEDADDAELRLRDALRVRAGIELEGVAYAGRVVHVFTHRRLTCEVYTGRVAAGHPEARAHYEVVRWVPRGGSSDIALSTLCRKLLAAAGAG